MCYLLRRVDALLTHYSSFVYALELQMAGSR